DSRCIVLDPLADRDGAADVDRVEHTADGIARREVAGFLVALAHPLVRAQRRGLGAANEFHAEQALGIDERLARCTDSAIGADRFGLTRHLVFLREFDVQQLYPPCLRYTRSLAQSNAYSKRPGHAEGSTLT